jgi:Ni,Fe-hydrogenase I small subunit
LSSNGKKLEKTELSAKTDTEVDKDLESAALRNTFDETLLGFFEKTSLEYKQSLQKALNSATSEKEKAILETAAKNILTFEGAQEKSGVSAPAEVTKL